MSELCVLHEQRYWGASGITAKFSLQTPLSLTWPPWKRGNSAECWVGGHPSASSLWEGVGCGVSPLPLPPESPGGAHPSVSDPQFPAFNPLPSLGKVLSQQRRSHLYLQDNCQRDLFLKHSSSISITKM